jgi:tetratricopeptide (TPR) repeat protein
VKVVCVHGVAGIGKTALVAKMLEGVEDKDVLFLRIRDWSTLSSVLNSMGAFLSRTGRRRLASKIRKDGPVDLKEILSILETELRELDALLIFDDFHTAGKNMAPFFTELIEVLPRTKAHAIIITRYTEPFYDRRHVVVKGVVKELRLDGLTKKDCKVILKDKRLDRKTINHVYDVTGGHPLSLELIGILGDLKEVDKFVFEEIYSTLTSNEKKILQLASVIRRSAPLEILLNVGTSEVVDELERKALINMVGEGYEIHHLLREFFHNRTSPKVMKEMHSIATGFFKLHKGPEATLETVFHTFYSGNKEEAIDVLVSKADQLVAENMGEDMITLIDRFGGDIPRSKYRDAYHLREKAAKIWGTWDNHLEYIFQVCLFEGLLGTSLKAPSRDLRVSCLGRAAEDTDNTIKDLESTLDILEKVGDTHGIGHTLYTKAWIRWIRGEFGKARREAKALLEKEIDEELEARTMMLLGGIEMEVGRADESRSWFQKAAKVYRKAGPVDGWIQALVFEASALFPFKRTGPSTATVNKMKKTLRSAADMARDNRLMRAKAYHDLRMCQSLLVTGQPEGAMEEASNALDSFISLHDHMGQSFARATWAMAILGSDGKASEAIELMKASLEDLDRACLDRITGILHLHLEKVYSQSGDTFGAETSRKVAESLGVIPRKR